MNAWERTTTERKPKKYWKWDSPEYTPTSPTMTTSELLVPHNMAPPSATKLAFNFLVFPLLMIGGL